ncbi:hypothetical protein OPV22_027356 [Ensete ventricosum]|uniref:Uncharacterized protein n=1 Tax=Ensete ventricosum TaxID=4639 RepID=A0AAV8PZV1_ENSVE|nr:hypothetical protein OPV22_027356 [Ensete ventricosum]
MTTIVFFLHQLHSSIDRRGRDERRKLIYQYELYLPQEQNSSRVIFDDIEASWMHVCCSMFKLSQQEFVGEDLQAHMRFRCIHKEGVMNRQFRSKVVCSCTILEDGSNGAAQLHIYSWG